MRNFDRYFILVCLIFVSTSEAVTVIVKSQVLPPYSSKVVMLNSAGKSSSATHFGTFVVGKTMKIGSFYADDRIKQGGQGTFAQNSNQSNTLSSATSLLWSVTTTGCTMSTSKAGAVGTIPTGFSGDVCGACTYTTTTDPLCNEYVAFVSHSTPDGFNTCDSAPGGCPTIPGCTNTHETPVGCVVDGSSKVVTVAY